MCMCMSLYVYVYVYVYAYVYVYVYVHVYVYVYVYMYVHVYVYVHVYMYVYVCASARVCACECTIKSNKAITNIKRFFIQPPLFLTNHSSLLLFNNKYILDGSNSNIKFTELFLFSVYMKHIFNNGLEVIQTFSAFSHSYKHGSCSLLTHYFSSYVINSVCRLSYIHLVIIRNQNSNTSYSNVLPMIMII